jgi:bifunctional DNase/RNase
MENLVEVKIDSLRVSLTNQQRIVVLKDINQERYLPVWIGPYEAESITIAIQEIEVSRPQTHDLIKNILRSMEANLQHVEISDLRDEIFFGTLVINHQGAEIRIDCRPSDAIAIAVRLHTPIKVSKNVMDVASIVPEEMADESADENTAEIENKQEPGKHPGSEDRLSIFEDYLKKRGIGSESDSDEDDKNTSPT